MKELQVTLGDDNFTQNRYEDELTLTFDKFSVFQEGVLQNIRTATERVDKMEASTLTGFTDQGSSQMEVLVEKISDLDKERIADRLHIDGLESRLNAGDDELEIGEVIVRSPEDLKSHTVEFQGEERNFGGFMCVYNILTRIHQQVNGEETIVEVMKNKKYLAILKMTEDEAITVYTFLVVVPSLFGGNIIIK